MPETSGSAHADDGRKDTKQYAEQLLKECMIRMTIDDILVIVASDVKSILIRSTSEPENEFMVCLQSLCMELRIHDNMKNERHDEMTRLLIEGKWIQNFESIHSTSDD